jgi:ribosome-associated protein
MDIRKLQRAIVDGLEDVKGQNILVFNTEHLSPLFERVVVVSGQSNRQTKALAASVRDAVRTSGMSVLRTEGEENGEWIIVDCGAAVVHVMQPSIRDYYRLEEIWGGKPVKIKLSESTGGLVKASEGYDDEDDEAPAPKKRPKTAKAGSDDDTPAKKVALKTSGPKKPAQATRPAIGKTAAAKSAAANKPAAKKKPLTAREAAATKPAGSQKGVAKPAPRSAAGKLAAAKTTRAGSSAVRSGKAPAKAAPIKKIVVPANSSRNAASAGKKTADKKAATKAAGAKKTAARRG